MADDDKRDPQEPTAEDIEKMKAALHKANEEAKKYRLEAKAKDDELAELKKAQDSSKSDMEKVQEQIAALEKRAETAERQAMVAKVAQAKKLPAALASRLTGKTQEELEADADQLIEGLGIKPEDDEGGDAKPPPSNKPTPDLKGGTDPTEGDVETNPGKLAESVPRF